MNEYLALGNALHTALELAHKRGNFDANYAHDTFIHEYNNYITKEEIFVGYPKQKKMEKEGAEMIALYASHIASGRLADNPLAVELEFKIPFETIDVIGKIDKLDFIPEVGYIVTDYKSGSREPDLWFLRHNLQLTAYAWAIVEKYGQLPAKLYWHHLRNGKLLETTRTMDDIEDLKRMISNALKMEGMGIRHRIYHEQICGFCEYAGDICDDKDLEESVVNGTYSNQKN